AETPNLTPAHDVCVAVCLSSFHDITADTRVQYFKALAEAMPVGGRIVITDFDPSATAMGPPKHKRVSSEACVSLLTECGLSIVETKAEFPTDIWWTVVAVRK
ncbi:hypothetical protein KIPB_005387, partial [Kipferlia bialata]